MIVSSKNPTWMSSLHVTCFGLLAAVLLLGPSSTQAFLLPSSSSSANTNKHSPTRPTPPLVDELKDTVLTEFLTSNLNSINSVLTGMGAGLGAWTAMSGPLQKKKSKWQPWQNMAASFALLASGATAEATALPLWAAASVAGVLATQQKPEVEEEQEEREAVSFAWQEQQAVEYSTEEAQATTESSQEPIWVENELGLLQEKAAYLLDDVTVAVDQLYEQANVVSSEYAGVVGTGGRGGYNGPSPYSTGYASGSKPLYFSSARYDLASQQPSADAVSNYVSDLDEAVSSLQDYTPEPYLESGTVENEEVAAPPRLSTIPTAGSNPFQNNQFNPASSWTAGSSVPEPPTGYFSSYLDEVNDGGVMAIPSYTVEEANNGETSPPRAVPANGNIAPQHEPQAQSTIPTQGAGSAQGSFAPTQPTVKGLSGVSLAQAGSYLEQLKEAVEILPSFANYVATSPTNNVPPTDPAEPPPKMTTVPQRQAFAQNSFAPTSPNVKGLSARTVSQAGGYLQDLKDAVTGLASFAEVAPSVVSKEPSEHASGHGLAQEDSPQAPKMTTIPMGQQTFHRDTFAPTSPSVKNIEAVSMSNYLTELGSAVEGLSSFVGTVKEVVEAAPKMTTVPAKSTFMKGAFAPTSSEIKNLSATTVAQAGGYLEKLKGAVVELSSFADEMGSSSSSKPTEEDVAAPKMTTVPMGKSQFERNSFAPTKSSIKENVPLSTFTTYIENLRGATNGLSSFVDQVIREIPSSPEPQEVPKMTTVPGKTIYSQSSFAPTKSNIKNISSTSLSQASNYLDQLKDATAALSSFIGLAESDIGNDNNQVVAPKMTTIPMGRQTFHQDSFAPTQPSVKNMDSTSMTSYLGKLGSAVDGLSSFVEVVKNSLPETPPAPKMTTVPMAGQKFSQDSYAPTKGSVKDVSAVSVSQAGGYLETLRNAITELSSFATADPKPSDISPEHEPAPKMTTVPMGNSAFGHDSFAPTRKSVKQVDSFTFANYLSDISNAAMGLSSFVDVVGRAVVADDPSPPKMTTVPMGRATFPHESFAPTKPSVKELSGESLAQAGGYLAALKDAAAGITSFAEVHSTPPLYEDNTVAPKMTTVPMGKQSYHRESFAPTSPNVKHLDSSSMTSYLSKLGNALDGLTSFVGDVAVATTSADDHQAPKMTTVPLGDQKFSQESFAPTKSSVKGLSSNSLSQAGVYLNTLKNAVEGISSFSKITEKPASNRATKAQAMTNLVNTLRDTTSEFNQFSGDFDGLSGHIEALNDAVDGMEGFVEEVKQSFAERTEEIGSSTEQPESAPFSSMPRAESFANSFAPTKPQVKGLSAASVVQAGGYLDQLKDTIAGLSSFADAEIPPTESYMGPAESMHEALPFSSMPRAATYSNSFAPTKPGVKEVSSSSVAQVGGYLDLLKDAVVQLSSFAGVEGTNEASGSAHVESEVPNIPKMTTIPMGNQEFSQASYAPTPRSIKGMASKSLSAYLDRLDHAVDGISSFVDSVQESTFFSSMPKARELKPGSSFAPTRASVKDVTSTTMTQAGGYLEQLKDAFSSLRSFADEPQRVENNLLQHPETDNVVAPKMTTVPMGRQTFMQSSFAPTSPNVKNVSSQSFSGYLSTLNNAVDGLSSFVEAVGDELQDATTQPAYFSSMPKAGSFVKGAWSPVQHENAQPESPEQLNTSERVVAVEQSSAAQASDAKHEQQHDTVAPKMTTVPMGRQSFQHSSFAPTKPNVKNMSGSASLSNYLSSLNDAVDGLSSFIEQVDDAVAFSSMPKPVPFNDQGSYAPTKPGVKSIPSTSVAQAGGYLNKLRTVVSELSSFATAPTEEDSVVAPKMTTVPMKQSSVYERDSFAPTKSSVKDSVPAVLPSYLGDLQDAVQGLASFVQEVASSVDPSNDASHNDVSPPRMTTIPARTNVFKKGAFAPTKASVKEVPVKSTFSQGTYLDALKDGLESLESRITRIAPPDTNPTGEKEAPKMTTIPAKQENLRPGGYAPTKSSIKAQTTSPAIQAGGYLDSLKTAVNGLSSFVDAVKNPGSQSSMPLHDLKASADRLAPFVQHAPTQPDSIVPATAGGSQPALDSAVANLNQKLSSLSILVSDLSAANDARSERLETKIDDLTTTVHTLNQSVANLASCIQALNDGFSGLMAVAESLQKPSTVVHP